MKKSILEVVQQSLLELFEMGLVDTQTLHDINETSPKEQDDNSLPSEFINDLLLSKEQDRSLATPFTFEGKN